MRGPNILLLLCCIEIMGAVLATAANTTDQNSIESSGAASGSKSSTVNPTHPVSTPAPAATSTKPSRSTPEASSMWNVVSVSHSTSLLPGTQHHPKTTDCMFDRRFGLILLMVAGGLIILCTILLVSTVVLTWKVCHMSRHIHSDADLISNSEYWMGTAQRNGKKSETEAKETAVLMSHFSQTQEEMSASAAKDEGGEGNKDGRAGEETLENGKEEGDTANADQASASGTGMDTTPSTKATAASASEGSEEPKDVV
ncbi:serine-rich adhesin for platelets-like [Centroberyx affinis]|uniref:serine-rich adhesin for platelets-like n=1 Tax=Centroberyx affinis TaxID=166261 RepID=UPI003A5C160B